MAKVEKKTVKEVLERVERALESTGGAGADTADLRDSIGDDEVMETFNRVIQKAARANAAGATGPAAPRGVQPPKQESYEEYEQKRGTGNTEFEGKTAVNKLQKQRDEEEGLQPRDGASSDRDDDEPVIDAETSEQDETYSGEEVSDR